MQHHHACTRMYLLSIIIYEHYIIDMRHIHESAGIMIPAYPGYSWNNTRPRSAVPRSSPAIDYRRSRVLLPAPLTITLLRFLSSAFSSRTPLILYHSITASAAESRTKIPFRSQHRTFSSCCSAYSSLTLLLASHISYITHHSIFRIYHFQRKRPPEMIYRSLSHNIRPVFSIGLRFGLIYHPLLSSSPASSFPFTGYPSSSSFLSPRISAAELPGLKAL